MSAAPGTGRRALGARMIAVAAFKSPRGGRATARRCAPYGRVASRVSALLRLTALCLALLFGACAARPALADMTLADGVVEEVNAVRASQGLPPLRPDDALTRAALAHAADQARAARMTHKGSDGTDVGQRLVRAGYDYARAKEAVAVGWGKPRNVTRGWWYSPDHRATLLHHPASEVGVGVARGADGRAYWTLIVAEPYS